MRVQIQFPQVGRKRAIFTVVLSVIATVLWIAAPAYLPWATVSVLHVVEGITLPAAVGWVTLLLMERRIVRDLRPADRHEMPSREQVSAR